MTLSGVEKETIILFNETEYEAIVYTYNEKLGRKLEDLSHFSPPLARQETKDNTGAVTYRIPKSLVLIRKPRNEESRNAAREQAIRQNRRPPIREKTPV